MSYIALIIFLAGCLVGWALTVGFRGFPQLRWTRQLMFPAPLANQPPAGLVESVRTGELVLLAGTGLVAKLCHTPVWLPSHTRELTDVQNAGRSSEGLYQALFGTIIRQYGPDFSAEVDKFLTDPAGSAHCCEVLMVYLYLAMPTSTKSVGLTLSQSVSSVLIIL